MQWRQLMSFDAALRALQKFAAFLAFEKLVACFLAQRTAGLVHSVAKALTPKHLISEKLLQRSPFSHGIVLKI
jgi:hypothetical protein